MFLSPDILNVNKKFIILSTRQHKKNIRLYCAVKLIWMVIHQCYLSLRDLESLKMFTVNNYYLSTIYFITYFFYGVIKTEIKKRLTNCNGWLQRSFLTFAFFVFSVILLNSKNATIIFREQFEYSAHSTIISPLVSITLLYGNES